MGSSWVRLSFISWVLGGCAARQPVPEEEFSPEAPFVACTGEWQWALPQPSLLPEGALRVAYTQGRGARLQDAQEEQTDRCFASAALYSMGEERLWPAAEDTEVYRFTWLPSFGPFLVIRAERRGAVNVLHVTQSGGPLESPDANGTRYSRLILPSEWDEFQRRLKDFAFWSRSRRQTSVDSPEDVDGSEWLLEGARSGDYRAYQVYVPIGERVQEGFPKVCLYLLELSGLELSPHDFH